MTAPRYALSLHKTMPREDTVEGQGEIGERSRDSQKVPQVSHCSQVGGEVGRGACSDDQRPAVHSPPVRPERAVMSVCRASCFSVPAANMHGVWPVHHTLAHCSCDDFFWPVEDCRGTPACPGPSGPQPQCCRKGNRVSSV